MRINILRSSHCISLVVRLLLVRNRVRRTCIARSFEDSDASHSLTFRRNSCYHSTVCCLLTGVWLASVLDSLFIWYCFREKSHECSKLFSAAAASILVLMASVDYSRTHLHVHTFSFISDASQHWQYAYAIDDHGWQLAQLLLLTIKGSLKQSGFTEVYYSSKRVAEHISRHTNSTRKDPLYDGPWDYILWMNLPQELLSVEQKFLATKRFSHTHITQPIVSEL